MKPSILNATAVLAMLGAAVTTEAKAQDPVAWTGAAVIITVSPQCASYGTVVGDRMDSTLQPAQVQMNPGPWANNGSFIGFQFDREWSSYNIADNLVSTTGPHVVTHSRIRRTGGAYQHAPTLTNLVVSPAITPATRNVTVAFNITDWFGAPGCTVRVQGKYTKVP